MPKYRIILVVYLLCVAALCALSGERLLSSSTDDHYVKLSRAWLSGNIGEWSHSPEQNDSAELITLRSGLRGRFLSRHPTQFATTDGRILSIQSPKAEKKSSKKSYYISFPWFPAVLMSPFVYLLDLRFNDVMFTILLAASFPVLLYLLLAQFSAIGLSKRTRYENLLLCTLAFLGTPFLYSAVQGRVFYTAHITAVLASCIYLLALVKRWPLIAGLSLSAAILSRPPTAVLGILVFSPCFNLFTAPEDKRTGSLFSFAALLFSLPLIFFGSIAAWYNVHRFGNVLEFGHKYLRSKWQPRIEHWGLFSAHYVPMNLTAMFALLPKLSASPPFISYNLHGLALWLVSPLLFRPVWPKQKPTRLQKQLFFAILGMLCFHLSYHNTGWTQFGYRFALDYLPLIISLLALDDRPLKTKTTTSLVIWSIVANILGAITFERIPAFYHSTAMFSDR